MDVLELHAFLLRAVHLEEDVENRRLRAGPPALRAPQDPVDHDALAGRDLPGDVVLQIPFEPLRLLAAAQDLRRLLNLDLLCVEVLGRLADELELRARRGPTAPALRFVALHRLAERLPLLRLLDDRVASQALERRVDDLRPHLRRLPDETFDGQEVPEVLRAQVPHHDPRVAREGD